MMRLGGPKGEGRGDAHQAVPDRAPQQSPGEYLKRREYPEQMPPPISDVEVWTPEMRDMLDKFVTPFMEELIRQGVPPPEAYRRALDLPEVKAERERILREHNRPDRLPEVLRQFRN